jgi:hypothetical protein
MQLFPANHYKVALTQPFTAEMESLKSNADITYSLTSARTRTELKAPDDFRLYNVQ